MGFDDYDDDDYDDEEYDSEEYVVADSGALLYISNSEASIEAAEARIEEFTIYADPTQISCDDAYDDGVKHYLIESWRDSGRVSCWLDYDYACDLDEPLKSAVLKAIDGYMAS